MCLLSVGLETLGLLLRIWVWIAVPMAVIILLVATYFNYLRQGKMKIAMRLAVEGLPGRAAVERREPAGEEEEPEARRTEGVAAAAEGGEEELGATGKEAIYRGILWMKEKYEQYRKQADLRYEQLREELGRSEHRYQELLAVMEQSKNAALEGVKGEGGERAEVIETGSTDQGVGLVDQLAEAHGQLGVKEVIIDELEGQLRLERIKVEELVEKLQANSNLLLKIYRELESAPDLGKQTGRISL
jgi:hypothetical protein